MASEHIIQFENQDTVVDKATWKSIYWRLQKLPPADKGERKISMLSKTDTHKALERAFYVDDRTFKNTKIAVGNLIRRSIGSTKKAGV